MNYQNIIGKSALAISLTGMLIVFSGLLLLSLYIGLLPKILTLVTHIQLIVQKRNNTSANKKETNIELEVGIEDETAVAIGLVIHLEEQRLEISPPNYGIQDILGSAGKLDAVPKRRLHA